MVIKPCRIEIDGTTNKQKTKIETQENGRFPSSATTTT